MARYTRTPVSTLQGINNELAKVELAMKDTLDRKGVTPNFMDANLDMNSRRILNLPAPLTDQEPLRKGDLPTGLSVSSQYVDDKFLPTPTFLKAQGLSGNFGFFEGGFTYNEVGDVGVDADGDMWTYSGSESFPVDVAAGTVPSEGDYKKYNISNNYTRRVQNIDELKALEIDSSMVGNRIFINEYHAGTGYGGGEWEISIGEIDNSANIIESDYDNSMQFKLVPSSVVKAESLGAYIDGSVRSQDFIQAGINTLPGGTVIDLGDHNNTFLMYTDDDGSINFGSTVLDLSRRVHIKGRGGKLKLDGGVKAYIAEVNVENIEIEGVCFDGNRENNANHPTSNMLLRAVSVDRGSIKFCQFINGASAGSVIDGCSRWDIMYNYYDDFYRNALQVASSGVIQTNENNIMFNYINGTDDGEFANGIFLSASADTSKKDLTCYRNKIIGNVVNNAGDWGIESGYRMFYTTIQGNIVDQAYNICIGARDNTGTIIDGNIATCSILGSQQINYQVDGNSIVGDDVAPNDDCKVLLTNNIGFSAGTNGINIKDARKVSARSNILIGRGSSLGSGINIKGDRADVSDNYVEAFQVAYRLSKDDGSDLSNLKLRNNTCNGVGAVFKHEAITLIDSVIQGNDSSNITQLYDDVVGAGVYNSRYFGNNVTDQPFKWSSFLNSFILSADGLQRETPSSQFGESSIFTPSRACTLRVKLSNGEVSLFLISGESTPTITAIAESVSVGDSASGKDFRIELSGTNVVLKRYAVSISVDSWFGEVM